MSYIVKQKVGEHIYLYEATSYWDKEKKQNRQKRKYLGKQDPKTGELISTKKTLSPKNVRDYGHVYLGKTIANKIGLTECLKKSFPNNWNKLLHLALYQLIEARPMYMQSEWAQSCYVSNNMAMVSQRISETLKNLGVNDCARTNFFKNWIANQETQDGAWLDITSFSSYSQNIDFCEWGYNRDRESLPQVNLGLLVGSKTKLPYYYNVYPGSIADVSTLEKTTTIVKKLGAKIKTLIIDRGFYSASNIEMLCESKLKFVIPMPSNLKLTEKLLNSSSEKLGSMHEHIIHQKEVLFYHQTECQIGENKVTAFVFMDDKRRSYETQILLLKLHEIEELLKRKKFCDIDKAKEFIDGCFKGCSKLFEINKNSQGEIVIKRDSKAVLSKQGKLGKFILITNEEEFDAKTIIAMYRQRDGVEKIFDYVKNELKIDRLRIHSRDALEGRLFIAFIAVILYTAILQALKDTNLIKKYSVAKIMMELRKIRVIEFNDAENMLSETTKTQREILSTLNIDLPNKPRY